MIKLLLCIFILLLSPFSAHARFFDPKGCEEFGDKILTCEPYICTMQHPITPEYKLTNKIYGILSDGRCYYNVSSEGFDLMTCAFHKEDRRVFSVLFKQAIQKKPVLLKIDVHNFQRAIKDRCSPTKLKYDGR